MPRRKNLPPSASRTLKAFLHRAAKSPWVGSAVGAAAGFFGGGATVAVAGALIGYLLHQVIRQIHLEKRILAYYENPGLAEFHETQPGLAAFCALASNIASQGSGGAPKNRVREAAKLALETFFSTELPPAQVEGAQREIEYYCHLAFRGGYLLNRDLLAESLAAKRRPYGDAPRFGQALEAMAFDEETLEEVNRLRSVLDPAYRPEPKKDAPNLMGRTEPPTPWEILGLEPGSSREEVKAHFRKLAINLHPDRLSARDEAFRKEAADQFIAARNAYLELLSAMRREP